MPTTPDIIEPNEQNFSEWFDNEYDITNLDMWAVGIIASTLTHVRTHNLGDNASYLTTKLISLVEAHAKRVREATLDEVRERARELQKNNQFTPCARCRGGFQPFCSCMPYRSALSDLISSLKQ